MIIDIKDMTRIINKELTRKCCDMTDREEMYYFKDHIWCTIIYLAVYDDFLLENDVFWKMSDVMYYLVSATVDSWVDYDPSGTGDIVTHLDRRIPELLKTRAEVEEYSMEVTMDLVDCVLSANVTTTDCFHEVASYLKNMLYAALGKRVALEDRAYFNLSNAVLILKPSGAVR